MTDYFDAAWAFLPGGWVEGVRFTLRDRRIVNVQTGVETDSCALVMPRVHNAHSHAFQWEMRGHSHALAAEHADDDFWSWRAAMYALAETTDSTDVERIATELYTRMRAVGFGSVGEFHYLHHPIRAGEDRYAMAAAHVRAAESAGLRLTLLPVAYHRGGFGKAAKGAQLRFCFERADRFIEYVDGMRREFSSDAVNVGIGVHSVRAVPRDWLRPIAEAGRAAGVPIHIHASEQRGELRECQEEYGMTPIRLLAEEEFLGPSTTVVHATHLDDAELTLLAESQTIVCACPSTERDLGDGLLRASDMLKSDIAVCVGSDSHVVVDAREEMRLLELNERLRVERRNVLTDPAKGSLRPGDVVLDWASRIGARSLGISHGGLEAGGDWPPIVLALEVKPRSLADAQRAFDRWLFC